MSNNSSNSQSGAHQGSPACTCAASIRYCNAADGHAQSATAAATSPRGSVGTASDPVAANSLTTSPISLTSAGLSSSSLKTNPSPPTLPELAKRTFLGPAYSLLRPRWYNATEDPHPLGALSGLKLVVSMQPPFGPSQFEFCVEVGNSGIWLEVGLEADLDPQQAKDDGLRRSFRFAGPRIDMGQLVKTSEEMGVADYRSNPQHCTGGRRAAGRAQLQGTTSLDSRLTTTDIHRPPADRQKYSSL